jgi:leucyl aminopeptidase
MQRNDEGTMKFSVKSGRAARQKTSCAIVAIYASGKLGETATELDRAGGGLIRNAVRTRDIKGDVGESLMLTGTGRLPCKRILLVGLGPKNKVDRRVFRRAVRSALAALGRTGHRDAICYLTSEDVRDTDAYRRCRIVAEAWFDASYRFTALKSDMKATTPRLRSIGVALPSGEARPGRSGLADGAAIGKAVSVARELGNLPPNVCTPSYLVKAAQTIARGSRKLTVSALSLAALKKLGMGAFLAVTRGSAEPPRFIIMNYRGGKPGERPVVLVGKGITFDSGGISIKAAAAMDEMKYDMCGAATVLGVLQAVAELELPVNVVGLVPSCENLPGGTATRPGDIVRTMSGQTVEILNTDAEGRLILCDALTYAKRFKPAALIDIATLTGACLIALGRQRSGLLGNSDKLADALLAAGEAADDRAWRLPLDLEYADALKSNFADVANVGGREAGTITAASFLSRFVNDSDWAHLDIAGTAWVQGSQKGGTGRPVPLLVEYLLQKR